MKWERQHQMRAEMNARFPKNRRDLGQQMFRACYYNGRMAGESVDDAVAKSVEAVRHHVPDFVPTDLAA